MSEPAAEETAQAEASFTDPNPWLCSLCGRMSAPAHIGPLHAIALFEIQAETRYLPRTAEEVAAGKEERTEVIASADERMRTTPRSRR